MPTVPSYDIPTQELANVQLNTFQAPNVQPMADIAGKQIDNMGKATMGAAAQFKKTADSIIDEIRDANVKAGDTAFLGKMQDILYNPQSGYMITRNKDAMTGLPDARDKFQKAATEVRDSLKDPVEQAALDATIARHSITFNQTVNQHAGVQAFNYRKTEAESRASSYGDAAIAAFGKPEFQTYLKTAQSEITSLADMSGIGDEGKKAALLKANTYVYSNVVTNLMLNNKFNEAKSVMDDAVSKGLISGEAQQSLTRTMKTGLASENGRKIADNLGSGKGATGTDADSIINYVMKNFEGGFVADDAGKGATNHGINSSANPDVDVKNLTTEGAAKLYKERYWNGIGADKLPENMRAIAFDAAVNQGVSWTNKAVAEAMKTDNPAQTLIDLRRERYKELIAKNPDKYKQYEGSWNNRVDALQANLNATGAPPKTLNEQVANIESMYRGGLIDDHTREYALNRSESNWKMQINGQAQFAKGMLDGGMQWVQQHPGADISQMDPRLQDNLKITGHWDSIVQYQKNGGKFTQDDSSWGKFLLMPDQQKAEMTTDQFANQYRGKLDDDHFQQGMNTIAQLRGEIKKGQNTDIVSNDERIKWAAKNAKIIPFEGKQSETDQVAYARFQREVDRRVKLFENTKLGGKRKVDGDELDTIINGVLTDKVKSGGFLGFFTSEKPVAVMDEKKLEGAFVDVNGRSVKLSQISSADRELYGAKLRKQGFTVTQSAIASLWAADHPEK